MARYMIDNIAQRIDFEETDPTKRTIQNAKNLLMCRTGEVPFDRTRGFDAGIIGLPLEELTTMLLPELDRLLEWEPDAEIVSAKASLTQDGTVYIQAIIDVAEDEDI